MGRVRIKRTAFSLLLLLSTASAISLPDKYDHSIRPNNGGVADVANVSMQILSIRDVNEEKQTISVDFLLRAFWVDSRLANIVERETVFVQNIPEVWIPHISIVNRNRDSEDSHKADQSLRLKPDGTVDFSKRISTKLNCPMSLIKYPFGRQTCQMQLSSNGYTTIHLVLIWNGLISQDIPFYDSEYTLTSVEQSSEREKTSTGEYSYAYVDITMSRCPSRVFLRVLLPCLIFTVLSYFLTFFMLGDKKKTDNDTDGCEDTESDSKHLPLPSKMAFHIIKVAVNALYLLLIVIIKQTNFTITPRSGTITGLDISTTFMGLVVLLNFVLSLQMCFKVWTRITGKVVEKVTEKVFTVLQLSIPVVSLVFFIAYIAFSLS